jgi:hypothetical protein
VAFQLDHVNQIELGTVLLGEVDGVAQSPLAPLAKVNPDQQGGTYKGRYHEFLPLGK